MIVSSREWRWWGGSGTIFNMIASISGPSPSAVKQRVAAVRGLTDRRKQQVPAHASVPARTAAIRTSRFVVYRRDLSKSCR